MELVPLVRWRPLSLGPSLVLSISGKMGDFLSSWFVQNVLPTLLISGLYLPSDFAGRPVL